MKAISIKKTKEVINGKRVAYHGSAVADLNEIVPNKCKHDKAYVYVCENIALTVVFAVKRTNEGIDFGIGSFGMPFIEELYDGAFEDRFRGKACFIYKVDKSCFNRATHHPQELVCEDKVAVLDCLKVEDAAAFLLDAAKKKQIKISFYKDMPERKKVDAQRKLKKALKQYLSFKFLNEEQLKSLNKNQQESYKWKLERRNNAYKFFPEIMQELEKSKDEAENN